MRIYEEEIEYGVKNDGMSDQQNNPNQQQRPGGGRPSSAKLNRERHERIVLLKQQQDVDRIKKLEELKEQAMATARLREEQDSRRKKHFEDLVKKEDDRRKQAEERRKMLDEERKLALQAKWDSKVKSSNSTAPTPTPGSRPPSCRPTFAFGSCTPRLVDNHVDGFLWKSQYNLNVARDPGMRASSAQDLHLQQNEVRLSSSMYDWNQQRTTIDNPLVHRNSGASSGDRRQTKSSRNNYDGAEAMRLFCGRRKTDLTPTIPIKRDAYDMSASMMSRSTSRGSGRVYSSMTRLDRSRSPGGNLSSLSQHQHQAQRPSRSKSTTHLQSTGLKLTRTEILRQALAAKKDGFRSVDPSRPPSSMSSSLMTSSTHSQVQMRPRNLTRKSRPASVHVTGISQDITTLEMNGNKNTHRKRTDTSQERKSVNTAAVNTATNSARKLEPKRVSGKTSPSPQQVPSQPGETSTIKRPIKKPSSVTKSVVPAAVATDTSENNDTSSKPESLVTLKKISSGIEEVEPAIVGGAVVVDNNSSNSNNNPFSNINNKPVVEVPSKLFAETENVDEQVVVSNIIIMNENENELMNNIRSSPAEVTANEVINNSKNNESDVRMSAEKVIENFESIESAFASGSDDFAYSSKTPEPFASSTITPTMRDNEHYQVDHPDENQVGDKNDNPNASGIDDLLGSDLDFGNNTKNAFVTLKAPENNIIVEQVKSVSPVPDDNNSSNNLMGGDYSKPKIIMTEEQAKAAIAEKRRLAREAVEREAARLEEEQRLEEERQRLEAEEADRVAKEGRAAEEERLRIAIEEQQKKEAEEKLRREEEEKARIEKEKQEREAAREAEKIRLEMEERLKREEEERLERRKRVEAIMARTRKKEAEQQQQANKTNSVETNNAEGEPINGHKENNVLLLEGENNVQSSISNNSLNNNYNNNNDFGGNNSTLIEFDGMMSGQQTNGENNTHNNIITTSSSNNPLITNNPLQDLLS